MKQELATQNNAIATPNNYVNTVSMDTFEGKMAVANAVNSALSLNDAANNGEVIEVRDIITTPGIRKSRDPRLPDVPCVNTYLIDAAGNAYMSQSDGIARSAEMLVALNIFEGRDSVGMVVDVRPLPNGNTVKSLKVIGQ